MDPSQRRVRPGDLIQISHGRFHHWAVYIGGGDVVHLSPAREELGRWGNLVLLVESHKARVRRQKMREVVQLHHFQVNNLLDGAYQPRPCGLIVEEALGMVGEELLYCLYTYNCEHFVTWLRYGRAESRQVRTAAVIVGVAVAAAAVAVAVVAADVMCLLRDNQQGGATLADLA
ncbi:phospholipase A and acyltransferase 4-like [Nelusetta ayraudi]|uniref:phospholipase A and acyltransferase 4-like n=1 Tax=Nelusetta ayraudi TaxID=303726 RepID=UPI003F709236